MLDCIPINSSIPARMQNCFINPFIEYIRNLDDVFGFVCLLFSIEIGCSEDMWQNEGLNRWDKMKRR